MFKKNWYDPVPLTYLFFMKKEVRWSFVIQSYEAQEKVFSGG